MGPLTIYNDGHNAHDFNRINAGLLTHTLDPKYMAQRVSLLQALLDSLGQGV
jgi:hypothetical protein